VTAKSRSKLQTVTNRMCWSKVKIESLVKHSNFRDLVE